MKNIHFKSKGFTLIELLITAAMLVILISVGISAYSGIFSRQELVQRAERTYHFLRLAQSQAVKLNKKVYVHFCQSDKTGIWKMAMAEQSSCDCFSAASCLLDGREKSEELADGQTLFIPAADLPFGDQLTSFGSMLHSVDAGSVTLADRSGSKLKVIQATRRLRICSPEQAQLGYKNASNTQRVFLS